MSEGPNVSRLITFAKRLAKSLGVAPAPDKEVRRVIDDVLYGRQILAAGLTGLITREETGYVLVGHWQSQLFMHGTFKGDDHDFVREVADAILGPRAKKSVKKKSVKKKSARTGKKAKAKK